MGSNACADVIDFEVLDFSKTQKSKYLENKLIFFSSNKKKACITQRIKDFDMAKNNIPVELTFR